MLYLLAIIGAASFLVPGISLADGMSTACSLVPGDCGDDNVVYGFIGPIGNLLITTGAGLTVMFVMWGGVQMMIAGGDDSKVSQGRNSIAWALVGFSIMLTASVIVAFIADRGEEIHGRTDNPILASMQYATGIVLDLMNIVLVIVMIVAGFRFVMGQGKSEETDAARRTAVWAIVGAIIINIANALVQSILSIFT